MPEEPRAPDEHLVNAENPWPGLSAFTEDGAGFFHGRDEETDDLFQFIQRKILTVLFGQSGLGKTSLLQAGVFPRLREANFLPVYIRLNHAADAPDLVSQVMTALRQPDPRERVDAPVPRPGESLWEYFHRDDNDFWSAKNRILYPVLVFDQFEEIFTLAREGEKQQRQVARLLPELAARIEGRPLYASGRGEEHETAFNREKKHYKIVFSLREDFLANLEDLKNEIPSLGYNRLRLSMMNGRQALQAVKESGGALVDGEVAGKIIDLVAVKRLATAADPTGVDVEPALLSVFCRELNLKRLQRHDARITADLVVGSKDDILREFYSRAVADLDPRVRTFIEERLLTSSGYRNNVALEDALNTPGLSESVIAKLIDRRLLRIEHAGRTPRLELTHDVLTEVIRISRDERRVIEAEEEVRRRDAGLAEELRKKNEELFRSKRRNAILLGACAAVIVFGAISFWEYISAQAERAKAQSSFQGADHLIDFMIVSLPEKLEPVGQLKVLQETAQKVIDYETKLPADVVRDPYRQMRLAQAYNAQGTIFMTEDSLELAQDDYAKALDLMRPLVAADGGNTDFKAELVRTLFNQAGLIFAEDKPGRLDASLATLDEGLSTAQSTLPPADDQRWNRLLVSAQQLRGSILTGKGDLDGALACLQKGIDLVKPADPQAPFQLGVSYRLMGVAEAQREKIGEAEAFFLQSIEPLKKYQQSAGDDTRALYELSLSYNSLGALYHRDGRQDLAADQFNASLQNLQVLTKLDPSNKAWLQALVVAEKELGRIYFFDGDLGRSLDLENAAFSYAQKLADLEPTSADGQQQLILVRHEIGNVYLMQDQLAQADAEYSAALKALEDLRAKNPKDPLLLNEIIHEQVLLGDVYYFEGKIEAARKSYEDSMASHAAQVAINNDNPNFHNSYAWDYATCPLPDIRSGPRARQEINLALQLLKAARKPSYSILDTLAAVNAENHDYKDAAAEEQQVIDLSGPSGKGQILAMKERLQLYQEGKPYHRSKPADAFY